MTTPTHDSSKDLSDPNRSRKRRWTPWLLRVAVFLNVCAILFVIAALTVRSFFADSLPYVSVFYYATPMPLLAGLAVLAVVVNISMNHRWYSVVWCFAAIVLVSWTGFESVQASPAKQAAIASHSPIKIAFWNVGRGIGGWSNVISEMQSWNADVIGIVECGTKRGGRRKFWQKHFPDHDVSMLGGEFVLLVRGTSGECTPGTFGPLGEHREISVRVDDASFDIILIDICSAPFVSRESTINAMADIMNTKTARPTLLMGDFNTPTNSIHFRKLRRHWTNAFEDVGQGYAPTWPVPAPMLVLDQIWYNDKVEAHSCELEWSTASDHRPILFEMYPPQ